MLCRDTSIGRHSRRLACFRSHVLLAYCSQNKRSRLLYLGDAQIISNLRQSTVKAPLQFNQEAYLRNKNSGSAGIIKQ